MIILKSSLLIWKVQSKLVHVRLCNLCVNEYTKYVNLCFCVSPANI